MVERDSNRKGGLLNKKKRQRVNEYIYAKLLLLFSPSDTLAIKILNRTVSKKKE
jgi:hypothetical protein